MTDQTKVQPTKLRRIAGSREKDVMPGIPVGSNDVEFEEPGAFGERVAEKMLTIAKEYFPPVAAVNQD